MWSQIGDNDNPGLARHVAIMRQMNRGYGKLTPEKLKLAIRFQQGELWHYQGQGFEIALLFQYAVERKQWLLAQLGFVGDVEPAQALDINVQRGHEFLQAHKAASLFCARPHSVEYPPLLVYFDLCLQHPKLQVTVVHQAENIDVWEIAYAGQ